MKIDMLYPLRRLHGIIHGKKEIRRKYLIPFLEKKKENFKTLFLILTPEHGNLGDHAIASAETDMLKSNGIDYIEITGYQLKLMQEFNMLHMMNGYPILINGGGNLGTLCLDAEYIHQEVIKKNPKSAIFILPNTIYYGDTEKEQKELQKSIKIYNKHKNLTLYAREELSYEVMSKIYKNVKLVPDMVFSLNKSENEYERKGCILCLRKDNEKTRTEEQEKFVYDCADKIFHGNVSALDMVAGKPIFPENREKALDKQFCAFSKSELVITDRLHGMIFCAITGTPCIVIDSKSSKLRGCYEWIKDLEYIKFADDVTEIPKIYNSIPKKNYSFNNEHLLHYYKELSDDILDIFNWR